MCIYGGQTDKAFHTASYVMSSVDADRFLIVRIPMMEEKRKTKYLRELKGTNFTENKTLRKQKKVSSCAQNKYPRLFSSSND